MSKTMISFGNATFLRGYVAILYLALAPFLVLVMCPSAIAQAWGILVGFVLAGSAAPCRKSVMVLLKDVSADVAVAILGLLMVPISFVLVPQIEKNPLDFSVANLIFSGLALLLGAVSLFMAMKEV